jgi:ribosomal protein L23
MTEQPKPQPSKSEIKEAVYNFFFVSPKAKQLINEQSKEK